jgi:hypothetical protein
MAFQIDRSSFDSTGNHNQDIVESIEPIEPPSQRPRHASGPRDAFVRSPAPSLPPTEDRKRHGREQHKARSRQQRLEARLAQSRSASCGETAATIKLSTTSCGFVQRCWCAKAAGEELAARVEWVRGLEA